MHSLQNGHEMPTAVFFCSLLSTKSQQPDIPIHNAAAGRGSLYMETRIRCGLPNTVGERRFRNLKSVELHGGWHFDNPMDLLTSCAQITSAERLIGVRCPA